MTRHTLLGNRDSDKILGDFEGLDSSHVLVLLFFGSNLFVNLQERFRMISDGSHGPHDFGWPRSTPCSKMEQNKKQLALLSETRLCKRMEEASGIHGPLDLGEGTIDHGCSRVAICNDDVS